MSPLRYADFINRIDSVKRKETKNKTENIVSKYICKIEKLNQTEREQKEPDKDFNIIASVCNYASGSLEYLKYVKELESIYLAFGRSEDDFKKKIEGFWSEYLMAILVQERYHLKHREGSYEKN